MGVGALYTNLGRVRIWGHSPPCAHPQKCGVGLRRWENQHRLLVTFIFQPIACVTRVTRRGKSPLNNDQTVKFVILLVHPANYIYINFITARAYARAVFRVVILSVCLSHACIVTKLNDALQIFLYHTKGQSLCYSDTKSGWSATPPLHSEICAQSDPPCSKNADFDRFTLITSQP